MKKTSNLLLAGILAAFGCSIGNAQIIYSNNFALGTGVDISNTPPTVANSYAGGSSTARWVDVYGASNPSSGGVLLDNGVNLCPNGDYFNLPFKPQVGHVYLLTVSLTFTNGTAAQPEIGFSSNTTNTTTDGRFNGGFGGYDWMAVAYGSGNVQYFAGSKTANTIFAQNGVFPANTASTNIIQILLDTRGVLSTSGTNWSAAGFVNGVPAGNLFTYANPNPTNIVSVGLTENSAANPPSMVQYNSFTLITTLAPFIVKQPAAATTLGGGSVYTNGVVVMADTSGGTLSYQWYANGAPLVNGGGISGVNTNVLTVNAVTTVNQLTNYYVIVTNNYGSWTSSLASLTVLTNPVVTAPATASNSIVLFGGAGSYVGSSPTFSVTAVGAPPLTYQWETNGVAIGGETNNSLTFMNAQANGPTNLTCVVSNSFGATNVSWYTTYSNTPTAGYPQAVLTDLPLAFYRLNEGDDGNGNLGAVCHDYESGANGVYTNVTLGQGGYDPSEPTETSMFTTAGGTQPSCVKGIVNVNLATTMTNGVNANFTVEAWANCISGNGASGGAPVVSQGTLGGSSFFLGVDTNSGTKHFQFYVRNAAGTVYSADDTTIQANDLNWHYLAGVCDEAHTNVSLYIDGNLVASTLIPANSGNFQSGKPVAIGAGIRPTSSDYDVPFTGNIDDVAIYSHALSAGQVIAHYVTVGGTVPVSFVPPLGSTNVVYLTGATLTIPATVAGSGPISYYWTNVTTGGAALASEATNFLGGSMDATLTIPNASASLSGDQLELVVNNSTSSTNLFFNLFSPAPPVAVDYSNPILYSNNFNGGTWSLAGQPPTVVNVLLGGTNTEWIDGKTTNAVGVMQANGTATSTQQNSWVLPFTPEPGYIYTISGSVTLNGNAGNWIALGFFQSLTNPADARINGGLGGYDWLLLQWNGNVQYFTGPAGSGTTITNATLIAANIAGTHTVQIVLDTTTADSANWMTYAFIDGKSAGTNKLSAKQTAISGVGIAQNGPGSPNLYQWNSFMLTQVAPGGGLPPYAYNPAPPTNVTLLAGTSLTIPTTTFGSAPFGYYWSNTNTAAILGSGASGITAPLSANLSVATVPIDWNGNTLALVVTNAYGTNISLVSVIVTNAVIIPTEKPTITGFSLVGGTEVMINATNGQSGGTYYLLGSTNLTTPLSQWLPLATNVILTNGSTANGFTFIGTNAVHLINPQQFYILSNTN